MLTHLLAFAGFLCLVSTVQSAKQPISHSTHQPISQSTHQSISFDSIQITDDVDWGESPESRWQRISAFASTPIKGWNSYDGWDWSVDEKSILANIDYLSANLTHYGYKIVTIDYYWYLDLNGRTIYMDEFGRVQPDPNRFPSSMGGQGFKKLAAYAHSKGLLFGIHTMRGVNQVAIDQKLRVEGMNVTIDQVYDPKNACPWGPVQPNPVGNFWSLDLSKKGGQEFYNSLYKQYADWGVDFIKNDCVYSDFVPDQIKAVSAAIDNSGRQMLYSLSPGMDDPHQAEQIYEYVSQYRITGDTWDRWPNIKTHFESAHKMEGYVAKPGRYGLPSWPDLDMLPLGYIGQEGANIPPYRMSNLTQAEQITLMSLWIIFRSPLHYGGDLQHPDPFSLGLITNQEALTITDHSTNVSCVSCGNGSIVYIWRSDSDSKATDGISYFSVHNVDDTPHSVSFALSTVTNAGDQQCTVRDIWAKKDILSGTDSFKMSLDPHASGLFKVYQCQSNNQSPKQPRRRTKRFNSKW